ncbi:feruloyl esterase a [Ophiocordyceps camponoti-floridani]|uniref:Feruloyl esterase a n=1 Tax=Ophiocordyceps camponoti-floridani TaxID=2030778 RepID=A0A8H4Q4M3_9HYPO|nr:feruloyl esterase a [Ophiocordyceps camponoti-floridani]
MGRLAFLVSIVMLCVSQVACNRIPISQQLVNTFRRYAEIASAAYAQNCPRPPQGIQILRYIDNRTSNTQGFIAADPRNNELIISLRGTDNLAGLFNNAKFGTTYYQSPGVHEGFLASWNSIAPAVINGVTSILRARPGMRVTITGHSSGAALASLATASLRGVGLVVTTYTFGQPRTGNQQYADYIDYLVPQAMYRITHKDDGVPQVAKGGSFRHHQTEFWQMTDDVSPATFYRCIGQEPIDCNNFVEGNGLIGLNAAHLSYLGVSMGDALDRGASVCGGQKPKFLDATLQSLGFRGKGLQANGR